MVGQTLGHYKIVDKLGAGGMGEVYGALDILERLLGSQYPGAITVHELRHLADWDPLRDHPRFQSLLEKYGEEG